MAFSVLNLCFGNMEDFLNMLYWNFKLDCSADLSLLSLVVASDWWVISLDSSLELGTSGVDQTSVDVSDDSGDRRSGVNHSIGGISAIVF
jgi:hypothetical protein